MGTPKEMAQTSVEQEADDRRARTGHQGTWSADVELFVQRADAQQSRGLAPSTHETRPPGHGRVERRRTTVTDAIDWLPGRQDWVGLRTLVMVEAWRTQGHETSDEQRYDISSLGPDAKQIGESVPGHWTIEHALHWGLDLACREDDSRMRQGHAPENLAMLRHLAGNLFSRKRGLINTGCKRRGTVPGGIMSTA